MAEPKVVDAATREGLPTAHLMRMRWVVTRKDDGVKSRIVLLGYQAPNLGRTRTSSPTCSRRARSFTN